MKPIKTNAMRILYAMEIPYRVLADTLPEGEAFSGEAVATALDMDPDRCLKSLCAQGADGRFLLFVVPVAEVLDLKKAARAAGEKRVELAHTKDLKAITGYERGSVSPIGLKKPYPVFVDETATLFDSVAVSGGAKGVSVQLRTEDLARASGAKFADLL